MKLLSAKLQYLNDVYWKEIEEQISCDITFSGAPSRSNWIREGTYTNDTIDSITVNFKRGYNPILDGISVGDDIQLKWSNGAFAYAGIFIVTEKYNTKNREKGWTETYLCFKIRIDEQDNSGISMLARGGEGGHVDDVEVTTEEGTISVVSGGIADIVLTPYAKKELVQAEQERAEAAEARKLSLAGGTMDTYAQLSMHSGRIVDLASPTGPTHAATKKYADDRDNVIIADLANETTRAEGKEEELAEKIRIEATNRATADTQLQNNIDTLEGKLSTEETQRKAEDAKLQENIDGKIDLLGDVPGWPEGTKPYNLMYFISTEGFADKIDVKANTITLDNKKTQGVYSISIVGATAETAGLMTASDKKTLDLSASKEYVDNKVAQEAETRAEVDSTLSSAIATETSERIAGDNALDNKIDTSLATKTDKTVTETGGAVDIIDSGNDQHGCVMQTQLDNTVVSFNTASENGEEGILGQIYAKKRDTNVGTRINITQNRIYYTKNKNNATFSGSDELATTGNIAEAVATKQNKLTSENAGTNITIDTTDPDKPIINASGSGLTLQSVYDMIYPVGSRYMGIDAPNVPTGITATWEKDNSVNGFYLQVNNNVSPGTTGAEEATCENVVLSVDQLPKHSHNMQHYHNRGDMEIVGTFALAPSLSSQPHDSMPIKVSSGAFYNAGTSGGTSSAICDIDAAYNRNWGASTVGFKASSSWSGLTSTTLDSGGNKITNTAIAGANESHKHKISGIEPRKLFAGLWKRTA